MPRPAWALSFFPPIVTKTRDWLVVNSLSRQPGACLGVAGGGCDWLRGANDQECANYLSWGKPEAGKDQAFNCDKFLHLTFVPEPLKLKQSNMNETNSFMGASSPETFMPNLWAEAEVPAIVDSEENIASTWEYHRAVAGQLWPEITTTPISISVPIMCHRESYSQWIGPRANTEPALSALYHRGQLSPGQGGITGHQEPGDHLGT